MTFLSTLLQVQTAEGKLYLFVAIDRTSKFALVRVYSKAGKRQAAEFLRELKQTVPYTIHTILTDNGKEFTNRATDQYAFEPIFDRVCRESGIDHRKT